MKPKLSERERKQRRIKRKLRANKSDAPWLYVFRSSKHIYAQLCGAANGEVIAAASTLESEVMGSLGSINKDSIHSDAKSSKSVVAAKAVGQAIARRAKEKGVSKVVFNRNGFLYHGRVKALADGAREGGLEF